MASLLGVYDRDIVIVSGKGARLTDSAGNTYLDFAAGVGVNGLGYGDRTVLAAIRRQAERVIHSSNLYFNEPATRLADRLVELAFPARVFFANSGAEAVEAAIKFARKIGKEQGRTELVAFEGAFHGRTMGALSLTWKEQYRAPFEPLLPGVRFCPWNDLSAAAGMVGPKTAAVFIEPVQGEGGVRVAPPDFLQGLADLCRDAGALLVAEEVQCGLGRTGEMFAYQKANIRPDMLTLAKPLGGGLPLGAVLVRADLAGAMAVGEHGSTFGGNPVSCAAGLAVLDRLTSPDFLAKVRRKGDLLHHGLHALQKKYIDRVRDVRGVGLMAGMEFMGAAKPIVRELRSRGVLASRAGDNVLRMLPPLVVKKTEIRAFLGALDDVLGRGMGVEVQGTGGAVA
ncbi:MAG TPA: acetylornithine/succinylornithine family transaminase [Vicinamibacteria bacterium]|nr:acetylornithine/succinylornithine family transaminase [Vicinamibacteria bacterium]